MIRLNVITEIRLFFSFMILQIQTLLKKLKIRMRSLKKPKIQLLFRSVLNNLSENKSSKIFLIALSNDEAESKIKKEEVK